MKEKHEILSGPKRLIKIAIQRWLGLLMLVVCMAGPIVEVVREPELLHNVVMVLALIFCEVVFGLCIWLIFHCCDADSGGEP